MKRSTGTGIKTDFKKVGASLGSFASEDLRKVHAFKSLFVYGIRELGLNLLPQRDGGGPGEPPVGFVGGTTSATEWYVFWAFEKLLGPEGVNWTYQESFQGGRHVPGGAVIDFVLYMPMQTILVRVQTWRFHFGDGPDKIQADTEQKIANTSIWGEEIVVDIYEQYFIDDDTGKAVLEVCSDAMQGVEWPNPIATGLAGDW